MRILYLTANPQWVKLERPPFPEGEVLKVAVETTEDQPKSFIDTAKQSFREYARLELMDELRGVTDTLFESRADGRVNLEVVPEVRRSDVERYVGSRRPDILHFSGHGEKGELVLNDDFDLGDGEMVPEQWLEKVLAGKDIDVAVLNCCWSESIADELSKSIPLTIGTTNYIGSDVAAAFSRTFYGALQNGATLRQAFDTAAAPTSKGDNPLYRAFTSSDGIWQRTLTGESDGADPETAGASSEKTPEQQLVIHGKRLRQMKGQLWFGMAWDVTVVSIAFFVAFAGHALLQGEYSESLRTGARHVELLWLIGPPLSIVLDALADVHVLVKDSAPWVTWEPLTVMTALAGIPVARIASYFWMILGTTYAGHALDAVGSMTKEEIENELETGRIDLMFKRLEAYET